MYTSYIAVHRNKKKYFDFIGSVNHLSKGDIKKFLDQFGDFFNGEILDKKKYIREFSRGNKQKIGIAAALISDPEVLVLDEPFASLDPSTQIRLKNLLKQLKTENNVTMLISSHDLNHVTEVCERIVVLDQGNIIHDIKTSSDTLKELENYFAYKIREYFQERQKECGRFFIFEKYTGSGYFWIW